MSNSVNNALPELTINGAYSLPTADGSNGQVMTTDGSGSVSFTSAGSGFASVNVQTFTSSGTYTPSSNLVVAKVECVGGGGGAAGIGGNRRGAAPSPGGGGVYTLSYFDSATIGASQSVTIGSGGSGGGSGGGGQPGSAGTSTSLGALVSAGGGAGGPDSNDYGVSRLPGEATSSSGTHVIKINGGTGAPGAICLNPSNPSDVQNQIGSCGGNSYLGFGARGKFTDQSSGAQNGVNATGAGAGGGGCVAGSGSASGGAGFRGEMIITEYLSS